MKFMITEKDLGKAHKADACIRHQSIVLDSDSSEPAKFNSRKALGFLSRDMAPLKPVNTKK